MDAIYERCCGLDIHKRTVVACMIVPGSGRQARKEIRTFGTMTDDLLVLGDWLPAQRVTHVAMESTGVFWKPLFNLLEDRFQLLLVNARDIKQVPGRKTDVKDCEWIADLLRHGLLKASFVPTVRSASYASWCGIARHWCASEAPRSIGCRRRSKAPISSSRRWLRTRWGFPVGRCSTA